MKRHRRVGGPRGLRQRRKIPVDEAGVLTVGNVQDRCRRALWVGVAHPGKPGGKKPRSPLHARFVRLPKAAAGMDGIADQQAVPGLVADLHQIRPCAVLRQMNNRVPAVVMDFLH